MNMFLFKTFFWYINWIFFLIFITKNPNHCNGTRTHNHLVCKGALNHLAKWFWPVWLNCWVFVYRVSGCRFESCCSHLNFRYQACFEQEVSQHSGNYRVWIHSETRTWHDKNIELKTLMSMESFFSILCLFLTLTGDFMSLKPILLTKSL